VNAATIDFANVHQTIRGFGGSDAWIGLSAGAEANALFGTGPGQIGLSILRARIDPSSTTAGSQWDAEVSSAQTAIAAGSNVIVFASPWSPPAVWKSNNNVNNGGSLNTGDYANYANYLESFVTYMANNGVNLYGISMQNEPDWTATYESCIWTPQQMDNWVATYGSVLTTKLIMPESLGFNQSYSDPALSDPNAAANISVIGGHLYGATPAYYANAVNAGKDLWMTEHYLTPTAGGQPTIGDGLLLAKEIHDSLTVGFYNAYVYWWVAEWSGNPNTGLVDTNNNPTYYGWAMAQFSRFVRPGYVRVDAAYSTPSVYVSAYKGSGHYVIVAINMSTSAVSQPFAIQNQTITSLVPYQTSATNTMTQLGPVSVSSGQITYALPAQSITTFVQ
jgi:glucuronoarabinoxylan endo-1,4-beta-xylanase